MFTDSVASRTEAEILAATKPYQLFGKKDAKAAYRILASKWHPDKGGKAHVFTHIEKLNREREKQLEESLLEITTDSGVLHAFTRWRKSAFELGTEHLCQDAIVFQVSKENADLADNFCRRAKALNYRDGKVKAHFEPLLPAVRDRYTAKGESYLVVGKAPELIRLADLKDHMGVVPERHVAWIVSRMLNLCVYLQKHNLSHNGISTETVYVNPELHTAHLLGGWFYATEHSTKMLAAPHKTLAFAPATLLKAKKGDIRTDLEMTKALARELLGDISGSTLYRNKDIPKALLDWLKLPCSSDALGEYQNWYDRVLIDAFGPKKFIELKVTSSDIY